MSEHVPYRCFDVTSMPVGVGEVLVRHERTGRSCIAREDEVELLLGCRTFKTLRQHAADQVKARRQSVITRLADETSRGTAQRLAAKFSSFVIRQNIDVPVPRAELDRAFRTLSRFAEGGFLVSESEIATELLLIGGAYTRPASPITVIGIPTRGRTFSLKRSLQSYLDNLRAHERTARIVVMDDSKKPQVHEENRAIVKNFANQTLSEVSYISLERRKRYALQLASHTGVPEPVVEFALLGEDRFGVTTGACRNALMLEAAGEVCLQVDDDTECKVGPVPGLQDGLAFTSKPDAQEYWFFENREQALDAIAFDGTDFLRVHEQLLAKSPSTCISELACEAANLALGDASPDLVRTVLNPSSSVVVTFAGAVGESGMGAGLMHLAVEGSSLARLVGKSESEYRSHAASRETIRCARRHTITDNHFGVTMNIGLDARGILPPFMPVLRTQDALFSSMISECINNACKGYLPYVHVHARDPDGAGNSSSDAFPGKLAGPDILNSTANLLLARFMLSRERAPVSLSPENNIYDMGAYLVRIGSSSPQAFARSFRDATMKWVASYVSWLEARPEDFSKVPQHWHRSKLGLVTSLKQRLVRGDVVSPIDLEGTLQERLHELQRLVRRFGEVLCAWPRLVEGAKTLRDKGIRLSE